MTPYESKSIGTQSDGYLLDLVLWAQEVSHVTATTWTDVAGAASNIATILAVVAGGAFAYMKFVNGRVLHARVDVDLELTELTIADAPALLIMAAITNSGTLRVVFPSTAIQPLVLTLADDVLWEDACGATHRELLWSEGVPCYEQDLLVEEGRRATNPDPRNPNPYLEPGERLARTLLVPLPPGDWVAYRVQLSVNACPKLTWRMGRTDMWQKALVRAKEESDGSSSSRKSEHGQVALPGGGL